MDHYLPQPFSMTIKYQLIILGTNKLSSDVLKSLYAKIKDLGLDKSVLKLITQVNFSSNYKRNAPTVCLYFGAKSSVPKSDQAVLDAVIKDSVLVLPVVSNLNEYNKHVPDILSGVNGFELSSTNHIESLVSCILEGFSLLRLSRRLFISYRRVESRSIAIQLFEKLEEKGFDVFLDTHSVRKGDQVQDELWHRMVDCDIVVLLDTPKFLTSEWTKQELMKAMDMSIGILQCIWPGNICVPHSGLCQQMNLTDKNFEGGKFSGDHIHFTEATVSTIISEVESLRARSLAARQTNMVKNFIYQAALQNLPVILQPHKTIITKKRGKKVLVIPTIGVPHAYTYDQSRDLIEQIKEKDVSKAYLLYDNRNIRQRWLTHLDWLNEYLPIEAIKTSEVDSWIKKMKR